MENTTLTTAYELLEPLEREAVDDYVSLVKNEAKKHGRRIALALENPIPPEIVRRSHGRLAKPLVRAALTEKIREASEDEDLGPRRLIREIGNIAHSNIADYIKFHEFGDWSIDLKTVPREVMAAIKTIKNVPTMYGPRTEIVLHDKLMAARMLGEMMGLLKQDGPPPLAPPKERASLPDMYAADACKEYELLLENT